MAEILTEQIEALKEDQERRNRSALKSNTSATSTGETQGSQNEPKQTLPKGVVLDKDGKPFVSSLAHQLAPRGITGLKD